MLNYKEYFKYLNIEEKDVLIKVLETYASDFSKETFCRFLATIKVETGFKLMRENMNYTTLKSLRTSFKVFRNMNDDEASKFLRNPVALANKVYNGRLGNRLNSNDGWNYRGGSYIQLTGRDWYQKFTDKYKIDLVNNPDLVMERKYAMLVAIFFWYYNGLNKPLSLDKTREIVNGPAKLGLDEFKNYYYNYMNKFKNL